MSDSLFNPMSVQDFLNLTLPEEFGNKRRYVPVCLGGMGESGMNFFAPDESRRDIGIRQSGEGMKISYKAGGKFLELEADFTTPPQVGQDLPMLKIARVRVGSFDEQDHYRITCFSRSPAANAPAPGTSALKGLFQKLIHRAPSNVTTTNSHLTEKRLKVALHVISHAYSSIMQNLVPEVGPEHPVFSSDEAPADPPLRLRNINAAGLAGIRHKGRQP